MLGGMEGQRRDVPHGALEHQDPARLRISDEDRHAVAEVLRHAAGEGRIDLEELDERLEAAYAAKTYGDLVPITADLPAAARHPAPGRPARGGPAATGDDRRPDVHLVLRGDERLQPPRCLGGPRQAQRRSR